jgi:hypothetical protein
MPRQTGPTTGTGKRVRVDSRADAPVERLYSVMEVLQSEYDAEPL